MNPFIYGEEVSGENFCGRERELSDLTSEIKSFQNILIYSPRRFGKTSLIKKVLRGLDPQEFITVYIDLYPVIVEEDFVKIALKSISSAIGGTGNNIIKKMKNFFKKISPSLMVNFSQNGTPSIGINFSSTDIPPAIEDLFGGFYRFLQARNRGGVVVFDEFQQIGELETTRTERVLRSIIQGHRTISYVFAGSKKHLIYDMFNNPERPFFKSTRHFPLGPIDPAVFSGFLKDKFDKTGVKVDRQTAAYIVETAESHPYYTQMLAHVVWGDRVEAGSAAARDVDAALEKIMEREDAAFNNLWDNLTVKQRRLLVALCLKKEDEKIYSVDFIKKYHLGSGGTVQRGITSLLHKGIIDKQGETILTNDIFLKLWVRKKRRLLS
jgi:hypothetical protein